jgi:sugar lactone lactonase YvrE
MNTTLLLVIAVFLSAATASTKKAAPKTVSAPPPKGSIGVASDTKCQRLSSFCLDREDRFLLCDLMKKRLRVVTADDKLIKDYDLDFCPQVVACRADGSILVAGCDKPVKPDTGKIALLDAQGKKLLEAALPDGATTATAVGDNGKDIFVCCQLKTSYAVSRFDDKLQNPTTIITGLRGCCGQMDFKVQGGHLFVAHNTKFLVEKYNRDGKLLSSFGKRDDGSSQSFKGCCEPKNICFDKDGHLYTAESKAWTVKKFSAAGAYINFIGTIPETGDCVRAAIACTKDNRIFLLDYPRNFIRPVLPGKAPPPGGRA